MSVAALGAGLVGGLGLFLLGMSLMTDGLKVAAGPALEHILAHSTRTRGRALASGVLVTAVVQSSSAVTVAAIGFVNAGLLGLPQALWVLFGANVGTTMTGWMVALVGLRFKIEALALPLIGLGVLLRLTGEGQRRGALGSTLAGFGLLFLGIAMLQQAFTGVASQVSLPRGDGAAAIALLVGAGALMTVLMQSSSASMAVALTAAQGGLLDAPGAAAVVIGANIGTTATALLASIGATPNARRAAAAHVAFNLLTGLVALALLPWLVGAIGAAGQVLGLRDDPATGLALFHTVFNVLGVLLMWPLADALTRWLGRRFRAAEEDEARPRHLDDTVLAVPALALDALGHEVDRVGVVALRMARAALAGADAAALAREQSVVTQLAAAISRFVERMHRSAMSPQSGRRLPQWLRVLRYHETAAEQAMAAAALPMTGLPADDAVQEALSRYRTAADAILAGLPTLPAEPAAEAAMESAYEVAKSALLEAGGAGRLGLAAMETALRRLSALRRAVQQAAKAERHARQAARDT